MTRATESDARGGGLRGRGAFLQKSIDNKKVQFEPPANQKTVALARPTSRDVPDRGARAQGRPRPRGQPRAARIRPSRRAVPPRTGLPGGGRQRHQPILGPSQVRRSHRHRRCVRGRVRLPPGRHAEQRRAVQALRVPRTDHARHGPGDRPQRRHRAARQGSRADGNEARSSIPRGGRLGLALHQPARFSRRVRQRRQGVPRARIHGLRLRRDRQRDAKAAAREPKTEGLQAPRTRRGDQQVRFQLGRTRTGAHEARGVPRERSRDASRVRHDAGGGRGTGALETGDAGRAGGG